MPGIGQSLHPVPELCTDLLGSKVAVEQQRFWPHDTPLPSSAIGSTYQRVRSDRHAMSATFASIIAAAYPTRELSICTNDRSRYVQELS
ncbi:hypothetical protein ACXR2U_00750 [Jatrophihabitans sp. YIM 134969]